MGAASTQSFLCFAWPRPILAASRLTCIQCKLCATFAHAPTKDPIVWHRPLFASSKHRIEHTNDLWKQLVCLFWNNNITLNSDPIGKGQQLRTSSGIQVACPRHIPQVVARLIDSDDNASVSLPWLYTEYCRVQFHYHHSLSTNHSRYCLCDEDKQPAIHCIQKAYYDFICFTTGKVTTISTYKKSTTTRLKPGAVYSSSEANTMCLTFEVRWALVAEWTWPVPHILLHTQGEQ